MQLVSLKVFNSQGYGYSSYVVEAIGYASGYEIPIINFSGAYTLSVQGAAYYDMSMINAIENYSGLFICAAGNNGLDIDENACYPGSYSLNNIISVGSSTDTDEMEYKSNFGSTNVDLFAPGVDVLSTYPGGDYEFLSGTSMAAPYVTGVAALILSVYPDLLACELKDTILSNVDDCGSTFDNLCVSKGRLNAYNALTNIKRHTMEYTDDGFEDVHTVTCSSCGCSGEREHDYDNYSPMDYLQHTISCDCGSAYTEFHTWNAIRTLCLVCGYDINGPVELYVLKFEKEEEQFRC